MNYFENTISYYELVERSIPKWFGADPFDKNQFLRNNQKIVEKKALLTSTLSLFEEVDKVRYFDPNPRISNSFLKPVSDLMEFAGEDILDLRGEFDAVLFLTHPGVRIYGHWLIDIVPLISIFENFFQVLNYAIVIPEGAPYWVEDLLSSLRFRFRELIRVGVGKVVFGRVFLATELRAHDYLSPFIAKCYFDFSKNPVGNSKLYISRKSLGASYRKLGNCEEVEQFFQSKGFEIYRPETEAIEEQIKRFSDVRILAGEAGSGMHNSLFCPAGSKVINIQSSRQNHFIQAGLCRLVAQECAYVFGRTESDDWNSGFSVDLNALESALNEIES